MSPEIVVSVRNLQTTFHTRAGPVRAVDGISYEISTRLVGMEGLSVLSRSSSRNYDRTGKTVQQIANDLGVDYVLEGSVRWQRHSDGGSQVRVSPVLVHAPQDVQVWADSYDRDMSEIFAIQTEIASAVATQIGAAISPSADTENDMRVGCVRTPRCSNRRVSSG